MTSKMRAHSSSDLLHYTHVVHIACGCGQRMLRLIRISPCSAKRVVSNVELAAFWNKAHRTFWLSNNNLMTIEAMR